MLFAHAQAAVEHKPTEQEFMKEWALLLYNAEWYAWAKGIYKEAERMLRKVIMIRKKILEQRKLETLAEVDLLRQVLIGQGTYQTQ